MTYLIKADNQAKAPKYLMKNEDGSYSLTASLNAATSFSKSVAKDLLKKLTVKFPKFGNIYLESVGQDSDGFAVFHGDFLLNK